MVDFKFGVGTEIIKLHFLKKDTLMDNTISTLVPERKRINLTRKN